MSLQSALLFKQFVTVSVKLSELLMSFPAFIPHAIYDAQTLCSSLGPSLRPGEAGCPLYNGAEGGHKDCEQRKTLRICSDEGTALIFFFLSISLHACVFVAHVRLH